MAAGIQPISIACSNKQIIPVSIRPLRKNDNAGKRIAINVMVLQIYQIRGNFRGDPAGSYQRDRYLPSVCY